MGIAIKVILAWEKSVKISIQPVSIEGIVAVSLRFVHFGVAVSLSLRFVSCVARALVVGRW